MGNSKYVILETDSIRIVRTGNKGRSNPSRFEIELLTVVGPRGHEWSNRRIDVTVDELFTLTEILDDLCDAIEDHDGAAHQIRHLQIG